MRGGTLRNGALQQEKREREREREWFSNVCVREKMELKGGKEGREMVYMYLF